MNWYINYDHFRADTSIGFYTVGDMGGGRYGVRFPDGKVVVAAGSMEDGKRLAEAHHTANI